MAMCLTLDEIKEKTVPIAVEFGIKKLSLFGSYARGEATDKSDIDLLIEKGNLRTLLQYFSFINKLEKIVGCHVDVVTSSIKDKSFLANIEKESIILYEKQ